MSVIDIVIISIGAVCIIMYAFFSIRKTIMYRKTYKKYIDQGMTPEYAKEMTEKQFKAPKKETEKKNVNDNDTIYKE